PSVSVVLYAGTHLLTARYAGTDRYAASDSAVAVEVVNAYPMISLSPSTSLATYGQPVTLTVTFPPRTDGGGAPSGTVTFLDGSTPLGDAPVDATGVAQFTTTLLAPGDHQLTAEYEGNGAFLASSTATGVTVSRASTGVTLAAAGFPAPRGASVTLTAT